MSAAPRFRDDVLETLSTLPGVSGGEEAVREAIVAEVRDRVDTLEIDPLGSLIARVDPPGGRAGPGRKGPHVMLCAHVDEVGIMVTAVEKEGRLRFRSVGGIDPRLLPSQVFRLGPRGVRGVVGALPPHLTKKADREKIPTDRELYLDIGARSAEEAESVVALGDFGVFDTRYERWGALRKGKAFDDRAGASVLVSLLARRPPVPVTAVFSVQEEVGLRGATAAARRVQPDAAIVLEGTFSNEAPGLSPEERFPLLGKGPVLTIQDRSLLAHERLLATLRETARRLRIPAQVKRPGLGSTDAGRISLAGTGVPAAVVSVPCRYIHAPAALLDVRDAERTVSLIWHALLALRKEWP